MPAKIALLKTRLEAFDRIDLLGNCTPLEKLHRLSEFTGRDIYIKRDDITPLAMGGNKLRKLEYLAAAALAEGADTLVTAGAIQSNHVRQTAAVAAKLGLKCVALLENPIGTTEANYLTNGNRLLLDLFNAEVVMCDELYDPTAQLRELADRLEGQGFRPYVVPVGGSNALGALGYVQCALEIAEQSSASFVDFSTIVVASGSAGTHAGLAVALQHLMPDTQLIGVTVSRKADAQRPKVETIARDVATSLQFDEKIPQIILWDDYFAPRYGEPNEGGMAAVKLLAEQEAMLLDPVYTGKAMAGLLDGIERGLFPDEGPILFIHTGGAPALFAYHPQV
ncbi:D-cysteine desulfhydrase [Rahnella selenatireducens]|uniref:D-cysteine desulfhydrase n=1 Tax=Rahnella selenatireducens TaxID=3389797 RepID=UPI00396841B9